MLNKSIEMYSQESTFVDLLELQRGVKPFLVFCLVFTIFVYIWEKLGKRSLKLSRIKTINDLPTFHHFPLWMPSIIEILVTFCKIRKEGIQIWTNWWSSINHSPIFTLKAPFGFNVVVIADPNLTKETLGSSLLQFQHKNGHYTPEVLKDGLLNSHPDIWKPHRKILDKYFTHRRLRFHLKTINKYGNAIIQNLEACSKAEIEVNEFSPFFHDKILSIILEIVLGDKIMEEMGTREISTNFRTAKELVVYRVLNPQNSIPLIWKFNPKRKAYLDSIFYCENYIKEGTSKSRRALEEKQVYEDGMEVKDNLSCIEHMILHKFSEKEIMDQFTILIVAGHETADTAFHFILQHLAEHIQIQRKCQDEIDFIFDSKQEKVDVTMDDLSELKYLEQCILETLRLTPTVPAFNRELNEQIQVKNYLFEKGTILLFSPWLMHRNPEIYPEPEKFDPDRFLPENIKARHPNAFFPFSTGPRNCIGWKFAMMELKTIMALILRYYDVSTTDKLQDVKLNLDITILPEQKFNLVLHKRKF